ncbi:hypothetical protein N5079_07270 [Planotetraspora sp. A-T 1434]|uniref:CBU_0592 family membrane protein n=1 Tax=Planotetraspora sp. A-T 1434 TaxID=2979219 RepID=UPI0021BF5FED|nr:hypothetical protein [Planotetraspora sp. A-T 1434]MCT9930020.1 hypothetical protein [Planotetraspora sp. A-T 1434]
MSTFVTIIGTFGAMALLYGYAMVSAGKMSGNGLPYQLLNFGGAATLMVNSAYHAAWPSAILNMVWSGIGVVTVGRFVARRAAGRRHAGATEPVNGPDAGPTAKPDAVHTAGSATEPAAGPDSAPVMTGAGRGPA